MDAVPPTVSSIAFGSLTLPQRIPSTGGWLEIRGSGLSNATGVRLVNANDTQGGSVDCTPISIESDQKVRRAAETSTAAQLHNAGLYMQG